MKAILHNFRGVWSDVKSALYFLFCLDFGFENRSNPDVDRYICHETLLSYVKMNIIKI